MPDSGRRSNIGMVALGDGSLIGGGWGTIHGSCTVASSMLAGVSAVDSWPTVGTMGGGSATTSLLSSVAGTTGGSAFVCLITGQAPFLSDRDLRLALVRVEVPTKDSGGSLGPPLSYRRYRRAGLSSVGRLPAAHQL